VNAAGFVVTLDADLRQVVNAWAMLPEPMRRGIVAMVESSKPKGEI
jgi:hypothetical protein